MDRTEVFSCTLFQTEAIFVYITLKQTLEKDVFLSFAQFWSS